MTCVLAIDPGSTQSAWVTLSPSCTVLAHGLEPNEQVRQMLRDTPGTGTVLAVEMVSSYGMAVGRDIFETVLAIGRFVEAWHPWPHELVYRRDVKLHLCNSARAKDANVRQALLDRYGGDKRTAIGLKKQPGPLYGFKSHLWSALAVGVTWQDTQRRTNDET